MTTRVTIQFAAPATARPGDVVVLHSNAGVDGDPIDWETPHDATQHPLCPDRAGLYGYGHGSFGHSPFGRAGAQGTPGYGHGLFGHGAYGHGTTVVTASIAISGCGEFLFAFAAYDAAGNLHEGSPEELAVSIHQPPEPPLTAPRLTDYALATGVMTWEISA